MLKRTRPERLWMIGTAVAAFLVVAIGYFFLISPQRSETDDVKSQVADSELTNATLEHDIAVLQSENAKLSAYQAALKQAQLALPSASGLPDFLRTLQSIGSATATDVSQLSVGAPTGLDPTGPASASASASTSASASATSTAAPANTVYSLPISAQLSGTAAHLRAFLTQLQTVQPRAVLISSIVEGGVAPTTSGRSAAGSARTTLQLTMQAFVAPGFAPAPTVSPASAVPSPTGTPTP